MTLKKNDAVAVISDWDRKGTVAIRRATVSAWGSKIVRLKDARTDEMFKVAICAGSTDRYNFKIVADSPDGVLEGIALEMAAAVLDHEVKRLNHCLTLGEDEAYNAAIRNDLEKLHSPKVFWR